MNIVEGIRKQMVRNEDQIEFLDRVEEFREES